VHVEEVGGEGDRRFFAPRGKRKRCTSSQHEEKKEGLGGDILTSKDNAPTLGRETHLRKGMADNAGPQGQIKKEVHEGANSMTFGDLDT